jgi:hypothetical protein
MNRKSVLLDTTACERIAPLVEVTAQPVDYTVCHNRIIWGANDWTTLARYEDLFPKPEPFFFLVDQCGRTGDDRLSLEQARGLAAKFATKWRR